MTEREQCAVCREPWDACTCTAGPFATQVPVTEAPETPVECHPAQFELDTRERPYRAGVEPRMPGDDRPRHVMVSTVSMDEILGDVPQSVPFTELIEIPAGHGTAGDGGEPPIKPDPERERQEAESPSELPEARLDGRLPESTPDPVPSGKVRLACGALVDYDSTAARRAGAVHCEVCRAHAESGRGMMPSSFRSRAHELALEESGRRIAEGCVKWPPSDLYYVGPAPKAISVAEKQELEAYRAAVANLRAARGRDALVWRDEAGEQRRELDELDIAYAKQDRVDRDIVEGLGVDPAHVWPKSTTQPMPEFRQEYLNVPPGYLEMPCSRILSEEDARFHTDCAECATVLERRDILETTKSVRERVRDAVEEWDGDNGYLLEGTGEELTDFVMRLLGEEVLTCAFCGQEYKGEKPIPRAQLAAHIRQCTAHPMPKELRAKERQLEELRRQVKRAFADAKFFAAMYATVWQELGLSQDIRFADDSTAKHLLIKTIRDLKATQKTDPAVSNDYASALRALAECFRDTRFDRDTGGTGVILSSTSVVFFNALTRARELLGMENGLEVLDKAKEELLELKRAVYPFVQAWRAVPERERTKYMEKVLEQFRGVILDDLLKPGER